MTRVISVRIPSEWQGRVSPGTARTWVSTWLKSPVPLAAVPGPGGYKMNLRLSTAQVAALRQHSRRDASAAIRGILALHLDLKPEVQRKRSFGWFVGAVFTGSLFFLLTLAGVGPAKGKQA